MNWAILFTTQWGLVYLSVLAALMLPSLLSRPRRWLAASMLLLFALDRTAVSLLPADLALFFLSFAYTLIAIASVVTHRGNLVKVMGGALVVTSIAFIAGGFGYLDWDSTGTIQEVCGLVAMLSILWRRSDGPGTVRGVDGRMADLQHRPASGAFARRPHR